MTTGSYTSTDHLVGTSPVFQALLRSVRIVAATEVAVLLLGESGTGKELLAREIHRSSPRADQPFVSLNCAALPEQLAESELFGHCKGAFSGADRHYDGRIRAAEKGTVFLDEVGELSLPIQAKLLRFLECRECQAVGETRPRTVDVRVIAATNRDLSEMVRLGLFRKDLYYRLNIVPLESPSLKERSGDVPLLMNHYMKQLAEQHNLPQPIVTKAAMACLGRYNWPGNIRELRNVCERLVILRAGQQVDVTNLPLEIQCGAVAMKQSETTANGSLKEMEVQLISDALHRTRGNRTHAARLLGITRDTLNYRLKKHALVAAH